MGKGRLFGDNEIDIIKYLQDVDNSEICFPMESKDAISILNKIKTKKNWAKWVDNSKNTNNPPDFYCDDFNLMLDVMRVNDVERLNGKNNPYNPTMSHEREIYNEIERSGLLVAAPNAKVIIIGDTGLPANEDHNFNYYSKNFVRVLNKHIKRIPTYRRNHPGHKTIFVVFDESTAYFEAKNQTDDNPIVGQLVLGKPHLFFIDEVFLNCFYNKNIDYLLWLTPHKLLKTEKDIFPLPRLIMYDLHKPKPPTIKYNFERMKSREL